MKMSEQLDRVVYDIDDNQLLQLMEVVIDRYTTAGKELDYIVECVKHKHTDKPDLVKGVRKQLTTIEQATALLLSYIIIIKQRMTKK